MRLAQQQAEQLKQGAIAAQQAAAQRAAVVPDPPVSHLWPLQQQQQALLPAQGGATGAC